MSENGVTWTIVTNHQFTILKEQLFLYYIEWQIFCHCVIQNHCLKATTENQQITSSRSEEV
ncbi:hypothetical protein JHK85_032607 [Glycine max]|nr:hypothetical protein JHK85_032607 [Glycine max]